MTAWAIVERQRIWRKSKVKLYIRFLCGDLHLLAISDAQAYQKKKADGIDSGGYRDNNAIAVSGRIYLGT